MAIPAARAVEFGRGVNAGLMRGSKHNHHGAKKCHLQKEQMGH